jgi:hypothetical protein
MQYLVAELMVDTMRKGEEESERKRYVTRS